MQQTTHPIYPIHNVTILTDAQLLNAHDSSHIMSNVGVQVKRTQLGKCIIAFGRMLHQLPHCNTELMIPKYTQLLRDHPQQSDYS